MHPELIQLGPLTIHWYGALTAVGFLVGLWTASRRAPLQGIHAEKVLDLGPWLIVGGIVGARLFYVISYWEESFAGQPFREVFMIHHGGQVFYGGFVGAALASIVYLKWKQLPIWKMADVLSPSIALGHAFGRIGCFMNGCCFGKACDWPWAVRFPAWHETGGEPVHPTQFYESGMNLVLYGALAWLYRNKRYQGQVFVGYLLSYAVARFIVEVLRGDYAHGSKAGHLLSPGQTFSLAVFLAGMVLHFRLRPKAAPQS